MIWLLFMVVPPLVGAAFALGMHLEGRATVRHWVENGYCPTCDRLTTEQEWDSEQRKQRAEDEWAAGSER